MSRRGGGSVTNFKDKCRPEAGQALRSHRSSSSASRFDRQLAGQLGAHGAENAEVPGGAR